MNLIDSINNIIENIKHSKGFSTKNISNGFHTFGELYEFRKMYNVLLFNEFAENKKYDVHKSWKHSDGEWCFGVEKKWFIVVAELPAGQISNHYKAEDWDLFKIPEKEKANTFDGHNSQDVLQRMLKNIKYGSF